MRVSIFDMLIGHSYFMSFVFNVTNYIHLGRLTSGFPVPSSSVSPPNHPVTPLSPFYAPFFWAQSLNQWCPPGSILGSP